jgi:hypothetical protein
MFRFSSLLVIAALVVPAVAAAKGPTEGVVSGPGFSKTVKVLYDGGGGSPGDNLTQAAGFFPAAFGQVPDPMLQRRPSGSLGPRYTVVWSVPGGAVFHVRQQLYPYAPGGGVSYTKPGQPIFEMKTPGGWYHSPELKRTLVALGLPARAAPSEPGGTNHALIFGLIAAAAAAAGAGAVFLRQRGQRSPSTSSTEFPAGSRT